MYIMEFSIFGMKCRLEIIITCIIIGFIIASFTVCSCSKLSPVQYIDVLKKSTPVLKEGFAKISDIANAASVNYSMGKDNPGSWMQKALGYAGDMGYNTVLARNANNKGTTVPLQDAVPPTMVFFRDNSFTPECCPSTYSSSTGCACTSVSQLNFLNQRGGNRTFPTEF